MGIALPILSYMVNIQQERKKNKKENKRITYFVL